MIFFARSLLFASQITVSLLWMPQYFSVPQSTESSVYLARANLRIRNTWGCFCVIREHVLFAPQEGETPASMRIPLILLRMPSPSYLLNMHWKEWSHWVYLAYKRYGLVIKNPCKPFKAEERWFHAWLHHSVGASPQHTKHTQTHTCMPVRHTQRWAATSLVLPPPCEAQRDGCRVWTNGAGRTQP